jgi:glycosyltransferase involved in cell wall biosynthesis
MPKISIIIPCFEYNGKGVEVLEYSFKKLESQTFRDYNVIISDHSMNNKICLLCENWKYKLPIKYYLNENNRGSGSANFNFAIEHADGEYLKLLCADDYLLMDDSLKIINENLTDGVNFLATGYVLTKNRLEYYNAHFPQMNSRIYAINTVGTPSCVTIKNYQDLPKFDINSNYSYDCIFYHDYINKYGGIKLINSITMANFIWGESVTSSMTNENIEKEIRYAIEKYEN